MLAVAYEAGRSTDSPAHSCHQASRGVSSSSGSRAPVVNSMPASLSGDWIANTPQRGCSTDGVISRVRQPDAGSESGRRRREAQ